MSLSKYYKAPKTFQAENIVKEEIEQTGWESLPQKEGGIFTPQKLNDTLESHSEVPADQPSVDATTPPLASTPQQPSPSPEDSSIPTTSAPSSPQTQPPAEPEIDLSNYIKKSEVDNLTEEAYRKGVEAGIEKAESDYGSASKALLTVCQQLDTIRETIIGNSGKELQEFALAVSEKILRLSIREQDHTIIATIEEALQKAVRSEEFTIYIHPDDYEIIERKSQDMIAGVTGLTNLLIKTDTTVEPGGARIESENCTIDATLASQFEIIREEVKKRL